MLLDMKNFILCVVLPLLWVCAVTALKENQKILANIAEGNKLLQEYQKLMSGSTLSTSRKTALKSSLSSLKSIRRLSAPAFAISSNSNARMAMSAGIPTQTGASCARSCCKVVLPPLTRTRQRTKYRSCTHYYSQNYSTKCGLWGWRRCGRTRTQQRAATCASSQTEYYSQPQAQICPTGKDTCCEGAVYFDGCCIGISQMRSLIEKYIR